MRQVTFYQGFNACFAKITVLPATTLVIAANVPQASSCKLVHASHVRVVVRLASTRQVWGALAA